MRRVTPKTIGSVRHTDEPWILERDKASTLSIYGGNDGKTFIGEVWNEVDEPAPWEEANARLIAAAPELLAALQKLVNLISDDDSRYEAYKEEMEEATAAIAKAEGRTTNVQG